MIYRTGDMLPEHGVDFLIVADAEEEEIALADGWRLGLDPLDHDGNGVKGGARKGGPRKND